MVRNHDLSKHLTNSTLILCLLHFPGPPDAPTNCSVVNQTTDSLDVQCLSGFDGGLEQHFLLEVADLQTGLLLANASDKIPEFRVSFDDVIYYSFFSSWNIPTILMFILFLSKFFEGKVVKKKWFEPNFKPRLLYRYNRELNYKSNIWVIVNSKEWLCTVVNQLCY